VSTHLELGPAQIDALREIGDIGAGHAATALSRMMGQPVRMGIPRVTLLPVEAIAEEVGGGDAIVAAMFLGVVGDAPGHMLFVMSEEAARNVVDVRAVGAGPVAL
jgi:chemotaxis protein CheC